MAVVMVASSGGRKNTEESEVAEERRGTQRKKGRGMEGIGRERERRRCTSRLSHPLSLLLPFPL
jgi:hypothetical protein